jgi:predicted metal-dependent peptidase
MTESVEEKVEVSGYAGIEREIIELILQRKYFYGHFLQQFKRHNVDSKNCNVNVGKIIKTLAVNITNDLKPNLFVNTDFYNSGDWDSTHPEKQTWGLTQDEKIALLEHEILHMLNKHLIRIENRDGYVWNLATDIAINQHIKGLPVGAVCPDCNVFVRLVNGKFPKVCPLCKKALNEGMNKCQGLNVSDFKIGDDQVQLDKNNPSETYYDILWQKLPKQVILFGRGMTGQREKEAKNGINDSSGNGNGEGKQADGDGDGGNSHRDMGNGIIDINGMKIPVSIDNHEIWQAGADNKEMAHQKVKDMVEKAMSHCAEKSQGHLPGYVQGLIDEVLKHKSVSWKSELRKFYGYEEFASFESSRKRLNRRFPMIQPGYIVKRKAHFVVATDSSGSISDDEFGKFFKEIGVMHAARVAITYVECDADIQLVEEYKRKPNKGEHKRVGYGGTDFRPVFKFVKDKKYKNGRGEEFKLKGKIDGIIYLTDGYGSFPSEKDIVCPVIWVFTPNHTEGYGWKDTIGKKIIMVDD